jgi:hypothetical protein
MESVREMVEKRAYELFLKRGGQEGYHIQDWVQAEKEIHTELESKPKDAAKAKPAEEPKPTTKEKAKPAEEPKPKKKASSGGAAKKRATKKKA